MFEKYGNMSHEDLIKKEEELRNDKAALYDLCQENGIPLVMADLFQREEIDYIGDVCTTAIGKIDIEAEDMKPVEIIADWVEYIKQMAFDDADIAKAIRSKEKSLKGCISHILKWSFGAAYEVDKDIVKAAGVKGTVKMGIPGMARVKKLIKEYYGGK